MIGAGITVWNAWWHPAAWSFDPETWIIAVGAGFAYWYGRRNLMRTGRGDAAPLPRAVAYYAALAVTLFTLQGPIAWLAGYLLSAHMVHHMLLLVVAAPLFAVATPWAALRAALPGSWQPSIDRLAAAADGTGWVGRVAAVLRSPVTAVVLFVGTLWFWHLPAAYEATLRSQPIHEFEHALFLGTGVLFWSHAVGTSWLAARLTPGKRIILLACGMAGSWILSLWIAFQPGVLYPTYAFTVHLVSGLTPLDDQRIAAGMMWAVGMVPFNLAIAMSVLRALNAEDEVEAAVDSRPELA